jgi:curved DNA-binding protein CbpA
MKKVAVVVDNPFMSSPIQEQSSPIPSPFDVLGIQPAFDLPKLKEQFLKAQLAWHPDQFMTVTKKRVAEVKFSAIVAAYEVLKDLKTRAQCLLKLHQVWPLPQAEPKTLMEVMTLQEKIEAGTCTKAQLESFEGDAFTCMKNAFLGQDWTHAAHAYTRWTMILRLRESTQDKGQES